MLTEPATAPRRMPAPRLRTRASWYARRAVMRPTSFLRAEPTFLVIGTLKSGTTSFFTYLVHHPGILGSLVKETRFFDLKYAQGLDWYRSFFPLRATVAATRSRIGAVAVGEGTPHYLCHPQAPTRVHALDPAMKLIVVLRDPIDRAHSEYWQRRTIWADDGVTPQETLSFEEALEQEPSRIDAGLKRMLEEPDYYSVPYMRYGYLARGRYLEQLERWLALFPRNQLLVLSSSDLRHDPAAIVVQAAGFLGLPGAPTAVAQYPIRNTRRYAPMLPETREQLARVFDEPNRRLYEFLGRDLGWTRPGHERVAGPQQKRPVTGHQG